MTSPRHTRLVLIRHGASTANQQKRFGEWDDVPLVEAGVRQVREAGLALRAAGMVFDVVYTSVLQRAVVSAWHCLDALDQPWLPVIPDWRLNERHYGALQGMAKADAVALHGAGQVQAWRRGYRSVPPPLDAGAAGDSFGQPAYRALQRQQVPLSESLHDTLLRVRRCWQSRILPGLQRGEHTLVVAHGNSIRALLMDVRGVTETDVDGVEVPNGVPLVFGFEGHGATLAARQFPPTDECRSPARAGFAG